MKEKRKIFFLLLLHFKSIFSLFVKSGIDEWIDSSTLKQDYRKKNSRGKDFQLVMSDEFNTPGRIFEPGKDHLWTSIEMADGDNGALAYYSHNMTTTKFKDNIGYLQIETNRAKVNIEYYDALGNPPRFKEKTMYYRSGMLQSWNKFCFQGGIIEVSAQLPIGKIQNPDLKASNKSRVESIDFYPTWPGIWLMGNLGRALFSASTHRMWPWSFNECIPSLDKNQRISACNSNPGFGLNKNQGRGAPEIDIMEGGGTELAASIQISPGMPSIYRPSEENLLIDKKFCSYLHSCNTRGSNDPGIPMNFWKNKGHFSWYSGLKYSSTNLCELKKEQEQQDLLKEEIIKKIKNKNINENTCNIKECPASRDIYGDFSNIPGKYKEVYGFNKNGSCMAIQNAYRGIFICNPFNNHPKCPKRYKGIDQSQEYSRKEEPFNYQVDAISARYPIHNSAYRTFLRYKIEWVTGNEGYIRWEIEDNMIFEIPASSLQNVPQNQYKDNPIKLMIEEPMYIILNVAVSGNWGTSPPNIDGECPKTGSNKNEISICNSFPMFMKVDYVRIWQENSKKLVSCDPSSHPTSQYIEMHIQDYTNEENPFQNVYGKATCKTNYDCTLNTSLIVTGKCDNGICSCLSNYFQGPRCTSHTSNRKKTLELFTSLGPSILLSLFILLAEIIIIIAIYYNNPL